MTTFAGLFASVAAAAPARAACRAAVASALPGGMPEAWRAAVAELVRSTAEPGHPWSCAGGTIALELAEGGAVLRVALAGEEAVARQVESPEDVVPLGQALLAAPLPPLPTAALSEPASKSEPEATPRAAELKPNAATTPVAPRAPTPVASKESAKAERRLLLSAGADARFVGGSNVAWVGPTVSAGVALGRFLPSISVRGQTALVSGGPPINELSVALALQARFPVSRFELRAGIVARGAAVERDLPRPLGEQSRREARVGALAAFVIPAFHWANVVISADGDVVAASRETTEPVTSTATATPTAFPTFTLGGSACLEVPL